MITLPNGNEYGPLIGPVNLTFNPGFSTERDRNQAIPESAPAGSYTYDAYVGDYLHNIVFEDHFEFEKSAQSDGGPIIFGWYDWGESFNDIANIIPGELPATFALHNPYPNPFNPETNLTFDLPIPGYVSLIIYDIRGREVARLADGFYPAGYHHEKFSPVELSTGVYFARLVAGDCSKTQKLLLIK